MHTKKALLSLLFFIGVLLGQGCGSNSPTPTPTLTPTPSATPIPPTATPSPTPTPQASDVEVRVNIATYEGRLPADGHTPTPVVIEVFPPEGMSSEGWYVGLLVEGGGKVEESYLPLKNNRAQTHYISGTTSAESTVRITATIDIPGVGRTRGTTEFKIVRQELRLRFVLPPPVLTSGESGQVHFQLEANPAEFSSLYTLALTTNSGTLEYAGESGQNVLVQVSPGPISVNFIPPRDQNLGEARICAELFDRPALEPACTTAIWGPPVQTLNAKIQTEAYWTVDQAAYIEVTPSISGAYRSKIAICYEALLSAEPLPPDGNALRYLGLYKQLPFTEGSCMVFDIFHNQQQYLGFVSDLPLWVAGWHIYAPGSPEPLAIRDETIFAAAVKRLADTSASLSLANGGTLSYASASPFQELLLHFVNRPNPNEETNAVLVRLFAPAQYVDPQRSALVAASGQSITLFPTCSPIPPNNQGFVLAFPGDSLTVDYLSTTQTSSDRCYRVYLFGQIATVALQ